MSTTYQLTDEDVIEDLATLEEDTILGQCGSDYHCYLAELLCRKYPEIEWAKVSARQFTLWARQGNDPIIIFPTEMQQDLISFFDSIGPRNYPVSKGELMEYLQEVERDYYRQLFPTSIYSQK